MPTPRGIRGAGLGDQLFQLELPAGTSLGALEPAVSTPTPAGDTPPLTMASEEDQRAANLRQSLRTNLALLALALIPAVASYYGARAVSGRPRADLSAGQAAGYALGSAAIGAGASALTMLAVAAVFRARAATDADFAQSWAALIYLILWGLGSWGVATGIAYERWTRA